MRSRRGSERVVLLILVLLAAGCGAGWHSAALAPGPLAPRQQVQVWHGGRAEQWHGVLVTEDSVSGVLFTQAPSCDSCRVALPRGAVDSLRLGSPSAGLWKSLGLGGAVVLTTGVVLCHLQPPCALVGD